MKRLRAGAMGLASGGQHLQAAVLNSPKLAQSAWSFDQAIAMQWAAHVLKHRPAEVLAEGGGEKVSQFPMCAMLLEHGQLREASGEARSVEPAKGSFRL